MVKATVAIPVSQVFFIQLLFGTIFSYGFLLAIKQKIPFTMPKKELLLYLVRAFLNIVALKFWIFALTSIGIHEATALGYTAPLWMIILARYTIKESFSLGVLLLVFVNIVGVIIILQPKLGNIHWHGFLASFSSILLWSIYEIICKKQSSNQHYMLQTFYFMGLSALLLAPAALTSWQALHFEQLATLTLLALLAVTNVTVLFIAYSLAPLTYIAPFGYARLVFTVIITAILHKTMPSLHIFVGAGLIMIANGYFTYRISSSVDSKKN